MDEIPAPSRAEYFDPLTESSVETAVSDEKDLDRVIEAVIALKTDRGHPALEIHRPDGAVLSMATDGAVAFLVWTDSLGESFQSVGAGDGTFVFDYFGAWSEAPPSGLVPLAEGVRCLRAFLRWGNPATDQVVFEPS